MANSSELLNTLLDRQERHVRFESGFHGDQWLDLESVFVHPNAVDPLVDDLCKELSSLELDGVCGALTGGAFLAQMIARNLDVEFFYSQRVHVDDANGLYTAVYSIPKSQQRAVNGKQIAIIDDVVSAGSATRATFNELMSCNAVPVAVAALLVQGKAVPKLCMEKSLHLYAIDFEENNMWPPAECPFCEAGMELDPID